MLGLFKIRAHSSVAVQALTVVEWRVELDVGRRRRVAEVCTYNRSVATRIDQQNVARRIRNGLFSSRR